MEPRYPTPKDLVQALHERRREARTQLWHHFRYPVGQLLDAVFAHHGLAHDRALLTQHALHSAETYLRTREPAYFEGWSWAEFVAEILLYLGKTALLSSEGSPEGDQSPAALPECPAYWSQTFFLPCEKVGPYRVGGDWFGGALASDGSLWVFVADVTGHGYSAYLLAIGLPHVWRVCWDGLESDCCQPAALLGAMHGLLEDCLPEGVYVEGTLARLRADGEITVAPAEGSRVLVRSGGAPVARHTLRGGWLGLAPPDPADQRSWIQAAGDELLLASDGLFDQMAYSGGLADPLANPFADRNESITLYEAVRQVLEEALRQQPQRDDITMIVLQRANTPLGGDVSV
jgi:serine phosphatase RsbU (regulator of sigma subunit)